MAAVVERKFLVHYVDSTFQGATPSYYRLGKDVEEYTIELSPTVDTKINVWGETVNRLTGFTPSTSVDTFYAEEGDPLFEQLCDIVNTRGTGSAVKSYIVDVLLTATGAVAWAFKEDCLVIPQSIGGTNGSLNVPYQVLYDGNRVAGTWNTSTHTFTPATE